MRTVYWKRTNDAIFCTPVIINQKVFWSAVVSQGCDNNQAALNGSQSKIFKKRNLEMRAFICSTKLPRKQEFVSEQTSGMWDNVYVCPNPNHFEKR